MATKTGVLLLHGLTGVPSEMRPVEKYLQKLGFDVEAPTLAGHGGSHEELLSVKWSDWISSAEAALQRLLERVDQAVICGLSMGGSIGTIVASKNPGKVAGVVMLSPTLEYDSPELDNKLHLRMYKSKLLRDTLHILVDLFPVIGKKLYWTETPPYGLKDERLQRQITKAIEAAKRGEDTKFGLFRTYFGSLKQMNHITDEFRKVASSVKCPVLIVSSMEDTLVSILNATRAYNVFGSTDKSLVMLTGCDHVLTLDLKRNYVSRLVGEFMEAVTGVQSTSSETDSQLTVEVHNRLNPLGNADWTKLVPGGRAIMDLVPILQSVGVHESQCLTLVVRWNNEPILLVPFFFANQVLQINGAIPGMVAGLTMSGSLTVPVGTFGFTENEWDGASAACHDAAQIEQAWAAVGRITNALCTAYQVGLTGFVDFRKGAVVKANKVSVGDQTTLPWVAKRGTLTESGIGVEPARSAAVTPNS